MLRPIIGATCLTLAAACNTVAADNTPGGDTLEEMQVTYPKIDQAIFDEYDRDGDGLLSSFERQLLFSDATDPEGIAGAVGALDGEGI